MQTGKQKVILIIQKGLTMLERLTLYDYYLLMGFSPNQINYILSNLTTKINHA